MTLRRALELDEKIDGLVLIDLSRKLVEYLLKTLNGKLPATKCQKMKDLMAATEEITPTLAFVTNGNGDDEVKSYLRRTEALDRMKFAPYASTNFIWVDLQKCMFSKEEAKSYEAGSIILLSWATGDKEI